jgi:hypothetical protein
MLYSRVPNLCAVTSPIGVFWGGNGSHLFKHFTKLPAYILLSSWFISGHSLSSDYPRDVVHAYLAFSVGGFPRVVHVWNGEASPPCDFHGFCLADGYSLTRLCDGVVCVTDCFSMEHAVQNYG